MRHVSLGSLACLAAATAFVAGLAGCATTKVIPVGSFANVQAPARATVGQPVTVTATFVLGGCQDAGEVRLMVDEHSKLVSVTGTVLEPPSTGFLGFGPSRNCPGWVTHAQRQAAFTTARAGVYKLVCTLYPVEGQGPYDRFDPPVSAAMRGPLETFLAIDVTE